MSGPVAWRCRSAAYVVASGGHLPPGTASDFYQHVKDICRDYHARLILDTSGTGLRQAELACTFCSARRARWRDSTVRRESASRRVSDGPPRAGGCSRRQQQRLQDVIACARDSPFYRPALSRYTPAAFRDRAIAGGHQSRADDPLQQLGDRSIGYDQRAGRSHLPWPFRATSAPTFWGAYVVCLTSGVHIGSRSSPLSSGLLDSTQHASRPRFSAGWREGLSAPPVAGL